MSPVRLSHRRFEGAGNPPLVILHGLLGSSRNWQTVARDLSAKYDVYLLDLRNHGGSPWVDSMAYPELAADVAAWLDAQGLSRVHLIGHSMGGKTAMRFALDHPERLLSLTVVDITPRDYEYHHRSEFAAMLALDLTKITDRREADALLADSVPEWAMRQFLLTNLGRRSDGTFGWEINLPVLAEQLPSISSNPLRDGETYAGRTAFVVGGKSHFVGEKDRGEILRRFPSARIFEMPESGHNPHIDDKNGFVRILAEILAE